MRKVLQWRRLSILLAIILTGAFFALAVRTVALRTLGRALVIDEVVQKADVIVVPAWAGKAGALEAADLVNAGVSRRVAVMGEAPTTPELELARRHVAYESELSDLIHVLKSLGVTDVVRMPESADGSEAEGRILPVFSNENGFHSVVVVSTADHSRRIRRVMRRSVRDAGAATQVIVKSARFSAFDPDAWWQTRAGTRTEIIEFEKLAIDLVRHPIS